jgi:hypothetical protein
MTFPRTSAGTLDKSIIKRIQLVLSKDFDFPEVAIAFTEKLHYIEPVSKELLDDILVSGIQYEDRNRI